MIAPNAPKSDAERWQRFQDSGLVVALEIWYRHARTLRDLGMLDSADEGLIAACDRLVEMSK